MTLEGQPRQFTPEEVDILTAIENSPKEKLTLDELGKILGLRISWAIGDDQGYGIAFRNLLKENDILWLANVARLTSANQYRLFRENEAARNGGPRPKK